MIFATANKIGQAASLAYLTAVCIFTAFVLVPLLTARRLLLPLPLVGVAIYLSYSAGSFHFPCRPEIFSYLFLAALISAITISAHSENNLSEQERPPRKNQPMKAISYAFGATLFFALWANCHTGFAAGIAVLGILSLLKRDRVLLAGFCGSLMGSLLTPYGPALWQYLPHLFFSQVNKFNQELFPLTAYEIFSFDFIAFDSLALTATVGLLIETIVLVKNKSLFSGSSSTNSRRAWLVVALAALAVALNCRRMVPFFALISMGYLYQIILLSSSHLQNAPFLKSAGDLIDRAFTKSKGMILVVMTIIAITGVNLALQMFPATLPQETYGFNLPGQALELIARKRPAGRMLNDPQFGDVLLLKDGAKAQVFIDTRFDMYGDKLVLHYWNLANCRGDWRKLLDQYKIDWVFFPPRAPLIKRLSADTQWRQLCADDNGVIMLKTTGTTDGAP